MSKAIALCRTETDWNSYTFIARDPRRSLRNPLAGNKAALHYRALQDL